MEKSSAEITSSNTTLLSPPHQARIFSSNSHSETLVTSTSLSIEAHNTTCIQDQLVAGLCKEIEDKNSRMEELEQKHNQICVSLTTLVKSLVQEIDNQNERMNILQKEREKKSVACEKSSRLVSSLMKEIECQNLQIADLKYTCSEMYCDIKKLVEERDFWHKLNIQGGIDMRSLCLKNKRLQSSIKKELVVQVMQGVDGSQSNEGQSCSMQVTGSTNIDIDALKKELEDKTDEVLYLQSLNQTLILKERASNNELLDAQRELLSGLHSVLSNRTMLGIKRTGELDTKPFLDACAGKFRKEEQEIKCAEVCSLWEDHLKDSKWHPFKHSSINGNLQAIIDESDEKLEELRKEWGEKPYKAVTNALIELNEYNPSGRYPVPKIWNIREEREVSLKEVIGYIIQQLKTHKRKRR